MTNEKEIISTMPYEAPVKGLLTLGEAEHTGQGRPEDMWLDYVGRFNFTDDHIPDLIRMACDLSLNKADGTSKEVWAPTHAWRTLGQLRALSAVLPLLEFANENDDDWLVEDLPKVFYLVGPNAIPTLATFLERERANEWATISALNGIKDIAQRHEAYRDEALSIAVTRLGRFATNTPLVNGYLVWFMIDFAAKDHIDLIREAFKSGNVDVSLAGDVEDVEIEFGLRKERETVHPGLFPWMNEEMKSMIMSTGERLLGKTSGPGLPLKRPTATVQRPPEQPYRNVGRNDPCPCGSGKKYKKCCLQ